MVTPFMVVPTRRPVANRIPTLALAADELDDSSRDSPDEEPFRDLSVRARVNGSGKGRADRSEKSWSK